MHYIKLVFDYNYSTEFALGGGSRIKQGNFQRYDTDTQERSN